MRKAEMNNSIGGSLLVLVFIVFLTLKLAEIGQVAQWSWVWVTAPLWMPMAMLVAIGIAALFYFSLFGYEEKKKPYQC